MSKSLQPTGIDAVSLSVSHSAVPSLRGAGG
jgi:hypothetical protein